MQYSTLSNSDLFQKTKLAAQNEKSATLVLLEYLAEVDRRKLYAEKAYGTLFEFVVAELGYSESQASDRVNAIRLMQAVPEVKKHLENGELTLTSASQIQRFIRAETRAAIQSGEKVSEVIPPELKEQVVHECLNQSKREVEKILLAKMSEPARLIVEEKVRMITPDRTELKFTVNAQVVERIEYLKSLIGDESLESIFEQAIEALIKTKEVKKGVEAPKVQDAGSRPGLPVTLPAKYSAQPSQSRYVPMDWRRRLYQRSKGMCEYVDPLTKIRCQANYLLQIDHIRPIAHGGRTELSNLRHLCRQHNQYMAMKAGLNPKRRDTS